MVHIIFVMRIKRSTKCSLSFATATKRSTLDCVLIEYGRVVNLFIDIFWPVAPSKATILAPIVNAPQTWISHRLRKVAAREAVDMINAAIKRWGDEAVKPIHRGRCMTCSSTIANLKSAKNATGFDFWLHLNSIGEKIILDLPLRSHRHLQKLESRGRRQAWYVITRDYVQFSYEIETGSKKEVHSAVGVDTGINVLASLDTGEQFGTDVKGCIERIKRCEHGSKGQQRARRALRQRIDEVAKQVVQKADLIVVENLKGITKNTKVKRRLTKNMRRSIGSWNVRYWLTRLQQRCEDNRVTFRSVASFYTSQTCPACNHVDRGNRQSEEFSCRKCGYSGNADVTAAKNILRRFLTGPYGAGFKSRIESGFLTALV